jgi:hypothetical protein
MIGLAVHSYRIAPHEQPPVKGIFIFIFSPDIRQVDNESGFNPVSSPDVIIVLSFPRAARD